MKILRFFTLLTLCLLLMACGDNSTNNPENITETLAETTVVADTAAIEAESCKLVIGWAPWEPYQYRSRNGEETGLDLDIARAVETEMGCMIRFQEGDWAELLILLREGKLDALASAGITEARREYAYFSEPYRTESFAIYVRHEELEKYSGQSVRALLDSGLRIGAVSGYSYGITLGDYEMDEKYQQQFTYNEISEENFGMLFDLKLDAVLEDPFVGADMMRRNGWNNSVAKLPLVIHSGDVHFMFSKKAVSDETVQKMNNALAKLKADGSYRRLIELYGG